MIKIKHIFPLAVLIAVGCTTPSVTTNQPTTPVVEQAEYTFDPSGPPAVIPATARSSTKGRAKLRI